jgi:hypothetical protein
MSGRRQVWFRYAHTQCPSRHPNSRTLNTTQHLGGDRGVKPGDDASVDVDPLSIVKAKSSDCHNKEGGPVGEVRPARAAECPGRGAGCLELRHGRQRRVWSWTRTRTTWRSGAEVGRTKWITLPNGTILQLSGTCIIMPTVSSSNALCFFLKNLACRGGELLWSTEFLSAATLDCNFELCNNQFADIK